MRPKIKRSTLLAAAKAHGYQADDTADAVLSKFLTDNAVDFEIDGKAYAPDAVDFVDDEPAPGTKVAKSFKVEADPADDIRAKAAAEAEAKAEAKAAAEAEAAAEAAAAAEAQAAAVAGIMV
jgi:hypothetical protein